jgi:hypothetical protein
MSSPSSSSAASPKNQRCNAGLEPTNAQCQSHEGNSSRVADDDVITARYNVVSSTATDLSHEYTARRSNLAPSPIDMINNSNEAGLAHLHPMMPPKSVSSNYTKNQTSLDQERSEFLNELILDSPSVQRPMYPANSSDFLERQGAEEPSISEAILFPHKCTWVSSVSIWAGIPPDVESPMVGDQELACTERQLSPRTTANPTIAKSVTSDPYFGNQQEKADALPYRANTFVEGASGTDPEKEPPRTQAFTEQRQTMAETYSTGNFTSHSTPSDIASAGTDRAREERKLLMYYHRYRSRQPPEILGSADGRNISGQGEIFGAGFRDDSYAVSAYSTPSVDATTDSVSAVSCETSLEPYHNGSSSLREFNEKECILALTHPDLTRASSAGTQTLAMDPCEGFAAGRSTVLSATDGEAPDHQRAASGHGVERNAAAAWNASGDSATAIHSSMIFPGSDVGGPSGGPASMDPMVSVQNRAIGSSTPMVFHMTHQSHSPSPQTRRRGRSRPGAYAILGRSPSNTSSATYDSSRSLMGDSSTSTSLRRDSSRLVVSAVLVDDEGDDQGMEILRREAQLAEQERQLAERAEMLQAWQEELERQQREIAASQDQIVEAEIIQATPPPALTFSTSTFRIPTLLGGGKVLGGAGDQKIPAVMGVHDEDISDALTTAPDHEKFDFTEMNLGDGPLRFAPIGERSLEDQIMSLSKSDRRCYKNLKQRWDDRKAKKRVNFDYPKDMILRFARNNQKSGQFVEERAWKVR